MSAKISLAAWGKRVLRWVAIAFAVPLGIFLLAAAWLALLPFPAVEVPAEEGARLAGGAQRAWVRGFFHVHAEHSHDGFGTLAEAAQAAARLGADFLVLTEHNALHPERPLRQEGVLVVPGVEISAEAGHVIAIGLRELPEERGESVLRAIADAGGHAILAHPVNRRRPWADPSPDGFAGFETLSLDSSLREAQANAWGRLGWALAGLVGDRKKMAALILHRPADAFARYDELNRRRPVSLLCGVDAHGLPPYVSSFGAMMLHLEVEAGRVWGRDPAADAEAVVDAIAAGRTFCSVPAFGDARSFRFERRGETLHASVASERATLRLFRDGALVEEGRGSLTHPAAPGAWRVEVLLDLSYPWQRDALWIATSSLHLEGELR